MVLPLLDVYKRQAEERPKVTQQIAEARDKGDLSENAEYDAAKEAQAHLEDKIAMLKAQLANARVLEPSQIKTDEVQILNHVRPVSYTHLKAPHRYKTNEDLLPHSTPYRLEEPHQRSLVTY